MVIIRDILSIVTSKGFISGTGNLVYYIGN